MTYLFLYQLYLILLPLLEVSLCYPIYVIIPNGIGRILESSDVTPYTGERNQDPIEAISFVEDPAKVYTPNDLFGDVHKFVIGVQHFVQHPPGSLYSALSQLQTSTKNKDDKKQKQKPLGHKFVLDPFGSLSLALGFSVNFQVTNTIGLSRSLAN
ncbi:hypothetical protein KR009_002684 [Drosophila setifemur]|nr:hypothetical protein KR009_002684 [Drosophila setifemur]